MTSRILITGTRNGWHPDHLAAVLRVAYVNVIEMTGDDDVVLVHGDAPGVDTQAKLKWESEGLPTEAHPADWITHGKAAGPMRNQKMVDLGANVCLALIHPTSKGTLDCMNRARKAGIPVITYEWGKDWPL